MFERYSEQARRVIFFARYEASKLGAEYIEPEHLLLGLIRESSLLKKMLSSDAQVQLKHDIELTRRAGEKISTSVDMPLSAPSKRVLAYSHEEAERLAQSQIGCGHLVLGLLRESGTLAASLLARNGVSLDQLRAQLAGTPSKSAKPDNQSIVRALRESFDPITRRLNHEIESATVFLLQ